MVDALCAPLAVFVGMVAALLAALRRSTPVEPPAPDTRPLALPCLSLVDPSYTWTDDNAKPLSETQVKAIYNLRSIGVVKADYAQDDWVDADGVPLKARAYDAIRIVGEDGKLAYMIALLKTNRPGALVIILTDKTIDWHGRCAALINEAEYVATQNLKTR